ncbi:MAG TPA: molybdenum cofactor biosynthesis protein MoaE [Verrucomicrobiae bacterium]|nr:molybdenum cofactor biosynthesis protein MoaE [Verrucomicrobiae bacterium]
MVLRVESMTDLCSIVSGPIDVAALSERVRTPGSGAVATFAGVVRDENRGRRVERLEYEAYAPMAEKEMARIIEEMRRRWTVEGIAIVHRTGRLEIGETSVAIAVAAAHRREALEAVAFAIDRLKADVPVWKKEHGEAGGDWIHGNDPPRPAGEGVHPVRSARRRADA